MIIFLWGGFHFLFDTQSMLFWTIWAWLYRNFSPMLDGFYFPIVFYGHKSWSQPHSLQIHQYQQGLMPQWKFYSFRL